MGCPGNGPFEVWDLDLGCCLTPSGALPDPCLLDGEPIAQATIDSAKLAASELLWVLTGRQFGCATVTIRPCRACSDECCIPGFDNDLGFGFPAYPFKQADGSWVNLSCGCQDACSCTNLSQIDLPSPVCSVSEVLIDGDIVPDTEYAIHDFKKLVRLGSGTWPRCNDLTKPDSEVGTWSVTLTYGRPVPELVLLGAAEMACEIIKNCVGKPCRLPQRISSVTRQGVSMSFLDPMEFIDQGLTGLYFVDLAARTYNPRRLQRRPAVFSPDSRNKWKVETWQSGDPVTGCGG